MPRNAFAALLALRRAQTELMAAGAEQVDAALDARRPFSLAGKTRPEEAAMNDYAHPYYWAPFILMGNWL